MLSPKDSSEIVFDSPAKTPPAGKSAITVVSGNVGKSPGLQTIRLENASASLPGTGGTAQRANASTIAEHEAFLKKHYDTLLKSSGPSWLAEVFPIRADEEGYIPSTQFLCLSDPGYGVLCAKVLGYFKRVCDQNGLSPRKDLEAYNRAMHLDASESRNLKKQFETLLAADSEVVAILKRYGLATSLES